MPVIDGGATHLVVTYPDELVHDALDKIIRTNIGRLLIVQRDDPAQLIGYLGRATILTARLQRLKEEEVRETGWLQSMWSRGRDAAYEQ